MGALFLELKLDGARVSLRGDSVLLETERRRLSYGKLVAVDATGGPIEALFLIREEERLRIVLDDDDAIYPLTIDPLLTETWDTFLESDQASAGLGTSVSDAGDVNGDGFADVIIGAPEFDAGESDEGAAFIFLGSAAGIVNAGGNGAAAMIESNQAFARLGAAFLAPATSTPTVIAMWSWVLVTMRMGSRMRAPHSSFWVAQLGSPMETRPLRLG